MRKTTSTSLLLAVAAFAALCTNALALPVRHVPDGGSSALLLAASCAGIAVARRVFGKSK